ncbi:hypothetical protein QFC21_004180 [Naganishia friedmannii]|uniref:Uncharacterized protein n=1 Tax=Naganishia friedmannii TaxID=89922 RepID=A0ACC2VJX7_9TREE|nr:hypothetical protein QFC21_004180 [Naganishia friedmannii]
MSEGSLIGVVLIARHGDRQGYFQDPHSYTASDTTITPLGSVQTYNSGVGLRNRYFAADAGRRLQGISWPKVDLTQVDFTADASEGQVIVDSTYSLAQGLYPADAAGQTITLANGTNVTSPLGGYVYVPIEWQVARKGGLLAGSARKKKGRIKRPKAGEQNQMR